MYREHLQIANNAGTKNVEIIFTTEESKRGSPRVRQAVFRNDGLPFSPREWSRLRIIAKGNSDVFEVGAFGVGFLAFFNVCEETIGIIRDSSLLFVWRGNSLCACLGLASQPDCSLTSFILSFREIYHLPELVEFAKNLCTSITFTLSLKMIRIYVDKEIFPTILKRQDRPSGVVASNSPSLW